MIFYYLLKLAETKLIQNTKKNTQPTIISYSIFIMLCKIKKNKLY